MRNLPTIVRHRQQSAMAPTYMALGFAGYLYFMKATEGGELFNEWKDDLQECSDFWETTKQYLNRLQAEEIVLGVIDQLNKKEEIR